MTKSHSTSGKPRRPQPAPATKQPTGRDLFARQALVYFLAAIVSFAHLALLTAVSRSTESSFQVYLVMALPAILCGLTWTKATLRRPHRWVAVFALSLTSLVPSPTLLIGQAWVMGRTWLDAHSGDTGRQVGALSRANEAFRDGLAERGMKLPSLRRNK